MPAKSPVLVMVLKGYPRISETFIANEIFLLEQLGFSVRIVSMRHPREAFSHALIGRIRAEVIYLPERILPHIPVLCYENFRAFLAHPRLYLRAAGRMFGQLRRTGRLATLKHLLQAGYLVRRALRAGEPAHLHAHFAHSPTSVARYAAIISGVPYSFTGHAKDVWTQEPERLAEKIDRAAFVVTCTHANEAYLSRLSSNGTPIYAVYHGIDLGLFQNGDDHPAPKPPYRLLSVARLTAKKGLDTVLDALGLLREQGVDFLYDLIGSGEDRAALEARAARLGLSDCVRFHGTLAHDQVLPYYRHADAFLLGCRILPNGDRDGVPNVLVEAMAMGVPVAATNVAALPELAVDGVTALTCPSDAPEALAANVLRLVTDMDLRWKLVTHARQAVAADFDNAANIRRLAAVFARQAGNPAGIFASALAARGRL